MSLSTHFSSSSLPSASTLVLFAKSLIAHLRWQTQLPSALEPDKPSMPERFNIFTPNFRFRGGYKPSISLVEGLTARNLFDAAAAECFPPLPGPDEQVPGTRCISYGGRNSEVKVRISFIQHEGHRLPTWNESILAMNEFTTLAPQQPFDLPSQRDRDLRRGWCYCMVRWNPSVGREEGRPGRR